jgi:hypothetical protein
MAETLQDLRLRFKRAFMGYYLDLCSPAIADPTLVYDACRAYFAARFEALGPDAFRRGFEEEVNHLAGEIEQDIRQRRKDLTGCLAEEPVDDRLWESVAQSWGRPS